MSDDFRIDDNAGAESGDGVDRPEGVPVEAEYIEEWELFHDGPKWSAWGVGERNGDALTGRWRLWRPNGIPLEEGDWRDGKRHGTLLRYHDDGTLAVRAEHRDGTPVTVTGYRSDNPSRDPFSFDGWPPAVRTIVHDFDEQGTKVRWVCYAADGTELTFAGEPVPERPAGVPEIATFWPNGLWSAPRWRDDKLHGVARHWNPDGTLNRIVYNRANSEVGRYEDKPLFEAARDGDAASVELCLAAGLGRSPGAARYAAHEELPDLALRLLRLERAEGAEPVVQHEPGPPPAEAPDDAVWVQSLTAYVVGDLDEETGAAVGTWRIWVQARYSSHYEHSYAEADFVDGRRAEQRSYFSGGELAGLERRGPDGTKLDRSWDHRLRLKKESEWAADGTRTVRRFHHNGLVRMERTTRDDVLVVASWFDELGVRTAEVTPTDTTVDGKPVEWWRALDADGAVIAEGAVEPGMGGGPVGQWRLFDPDGTDLGTVDFDGLDQLAVNPDLGRIAHTLRTWHAAPTPPELADADTVPWADLPTFYSSGRHLPFLLKGLTLADPHACSTPLALLSHLLWHQETIITATGPAYRYMTSLVDRVATDDDRKQLLELLVDIVTVDNVTGETHDGTVSQVQELKSLFAGVPAAGEWSTDYTDYDWEDAYHEIFTSLADAVPVWKALATHQRADIRHQAVVLLAAAPGTVAAAALRELLTTGPEREIRAEILLGLALHDPDPHNRQALERHLTDDDPLLRFCAALSWIRQGYTPTDDAVSTLVALLRDDLDPTGYGGLGLAWDELDETVAALALLPADQADTYLADLCVVLGKVQPHEAVAVADTLLNIAFPATEYQDGTPLTDRQHTVIHAVADDPGAWDTRYNLRELLSRKQLPDDVDELRALADASAKP